MQELLRHKLKIEGLNRLEGAARTEDDFHFVVKRWDMIQKRRERRDGDCETLLSGDMFDWSAFDAEKNMRSEDDILSIMFSCACQMHELMSDPDISRLLNRATEKQKAVFFPRFIKSCPTAKIAQCHGMTDRNVRKLIDLMLENIRRDLYVALKKRHETVPLSATREEKEFLANYIPKVKKGKNI